MLTNERPAIEPRRPITGLEKCQDTTTMKRKETQQAAVFPTGNIMKASVLRTAALKMAYNLLNSDFLFKDLLLIS
jgi:hypothetical protein